MINAESLVNDMMEVVGCLHKDLTLFYELLGQNLLIAENTQDLSSIWAIVRAQIRQTASFFEASCFHFRFIGGEFLKITGRKVPEEIGKYLDPQNKFKFKNNIKLLFKERIKVSLKYLAFAFKKELILDTSSKEWNALCYLIEKRDNITHPKSIHDLDVNKDDLEKVNQAIFWFSSQLFQITGKERPILKNPTEEEISAIKKSMQAKMLASIPKK